MNIRLKINRFLWPQTCWLCQAPSGHAAICPACTQAIRQRRPHTCSRCALPLAQDQATCGQCQRHPPQFSYTRAAHIYEHPLSHLVQAFKYHHGYGLAKFLCTPLFGFADVPDAFLPMPQHPLRLRERGYDQTRLLARELARHYRRPLLDTACRRVRHTPRQTDLTLAERQHNLAGAFVCNASKVRGLHIGMVDDVMTTGSSLQELATSLHQMGAAKTGCWVIARALPNPAS